MDVETEQIVRDLRRTATPGDPSHRAAQYIETAYQDFQRRRNNNQLAGNEAGNEITAGLHDILQSANAAQRHAARHEAPQQDTATRDLLTKETLSLLRQEREHELGNEEEKNDYEYIDIVRNIYRGRYSYVARLIALTARYADELPHDLLHPSTRLRIKKRLDEGGYVSEAIRVQEVEREFDENGGCTWEDLVDPGLAGNARIACSELAQMLPRLHGLTIRHVIDYVSSANANEQHACFFDFFCAVVAFTWRFNSVMAAQPYKTKYEHEAVQQGLRTASHRLRDYCLVHNTIHHNARMPPRSLSELRGKDGAFY